MQADFKDDWQRVQQLRDQTVSFAGETGVDETKLIRNIDELLMNIDKELSADSELYPLLRAYVAARSSSPEVPPLSQHLFTREQWLDEIKTNPLSLKHAPQDIQNDYEIVLNAVSADGRAIEFASSELQQDPYIFLITCKQNKQEALAMLANYPLLLENEEFSETFWNILNSEEVDLGSFSKQAR